MWRIKHSLMCFIAWILPEPHKFEMLSKAFIYRMKHTTWEELEKPNDD